MIFYSADFSVLTPSSGLRMILASRMTHFGRRYPPRVALFSTSVPLDINKTCVLSRLDLATCSEIVQPPKWCYPRCKTPPSRSVQHFERLLSDTYSLDSFEFGLCLFGVHGSGFFLSACTSWISVFPLMSLPRRCSIFVVPPPHYLDE